MKKMSDSLSANKTAKYSGKKHLALFLKNFFAVFLFPQRLIL